MEKNQGASKKNASWTRVVLFTSLYVLFLESIIEWAIVLYLYGNRYVDSKMTPSLILVLVASFLTVPLVTLHSFLAWQHNKVTGFGIQKSILHTVSTYLLRLTIIVWLSSSVAGLVVISQHVSCLPDTMPGSFWKVGVSCALHRTAIIVSVLAFITVCLYFCAREICDRPYDVSLLGVYKPKEHSCDDSIFSSSSVETENSLKPDIIHVYERPDDFYRRRLYLSSSDNSIQKSYAPTLQYPAPICTTAQFNFSPDHESERAEILSGSSPSPIDTLREGSIFPDVGSISRTPTTATSTTCPDPNTQHPIPELPSRLGSLSDPCHKRQKSSVSVSSIRRFLPKVFPFNLPLSLDPQIRALSDPSVPHDVEKQSDPGFTNESPNVQLSSPSEEKQVAAPSIDLPEPVPTLEVSSLQDHRPHRPAPPRTMTMNSANAPEVVVSLPRSRNPPRVNTSYTVPNPRHPQLVYRPVPPNPLAWHPVNPTPKRRASSFEPVAITRQAARRASSRRHSQAYQFENSQIPRYTRSQYHPQAHYGSYSRNPRRMRSLASRNDVEILYPSTRRPRSTTCGGVGIPGVLDSIRETGPSVDGCPDNDIDDETTYRGTTRTSIHAY
ncbi:hypothetical protein FE257_012735 [Aspergillus nanangensis]|uniref:Uncharacterized protein n=1 Tax=Aspergillus nanangensis TaxID=2582783 RepID=A0AAD4GPV3_ASPNN|nr:hypothetical protein FE257_012735 [Aspergillus nanangensis]